MKHKRAHFGGFWCSPESRGFLQTPLRFLWIRPYDIVNVELSRAGNEAPDARHHLSDAARPVLRISLPLAAQRRLGLGAQKQAAEVLPVRGKNRHARFKTARNSGIGRPVSATRVGMVTKRR